MGAPLQLVVHLLEAQRHGKAGIETVLGAVEQGHHRQLGERHRDEFSFKSVEEALGSNAPHRHTTGTDTERAADFRRSFCQSAGMMSCQFG